MFERRLYSRLGAGLTHEIRELVNDSSVAFGLSGDVVSPRGEWQDRLDRICVAGGKTRRDTLIGYVNGVPCSCWQFVIPRGSNNSYGEGVFVEPVARGHGVAMKLLDGLISELDDQGIKRFYVGYPGENRWSARIRLSVNAQRFARSVVGRFNGAVIETGYSSKGFIRRYALDVARVNRCLISAESFEAHAAVNC